MTKKLDELDYHSLSAEDKLRWHLLHDCTCGFLEKDDYFTSAGHYSNCPMHNPDDESWDYIYWYDYPPQ